MWRIFFVREREGTMIYEFFLGKGDFKLNFPVLFAIQFNRNFCNHQDKKERNFLNSFMVH